MGIAALAAIPEVVIPEVAAVSALPEIAASAIPAALTAIPDLSLDLAVTAPAVASTAADIAGPLAASAIPAAATAAPSVLSDMLSNLNPVSSAEAATIPTNALPTATPLSDTAVHPGLTAASSLNPSPASITPTPGPAAAAPSAPRESDPLKMPCGSTKGEPNRTQSTEHLTKALNWAKEKDKFPEWRIQVEAELARRRQSGEDDELDSSELPF